MPPNNLIFLRPQEGGREQGRGHPGRPADTDQCCLIDILVISVLTVFLFVKKKKKAPAADVRVHAHTCTRTQTLTEQQIFWQASIRPLCGIQTFEKSLASCSCTSRKVCDRNPSIGDLRLEVFLFCFFRRFVQVMQRLKI